MKNQRKKIIASFLLAAIICGTGVFATPAKAQISGLGSSVPVEGAGGHLNQIDRVVSQQIDETSMMHELIRAGVIAGMNSAFRAMSQKLIGTLEEKLGVKNHLYYADALVEAKYLTDSLRKQYGEDAVPAGAGGDIVRTAALFESLGINTGGFSPAQIAALGVEASRGDKANLARETQRMIVGAASLFTSSVSCGGVNGEAIRTAANYMAAASAGVVASEIDPRGGVEFYEQMARLGSPLASPDFWTLQFQDIAAQNEARARQAAALELTSPGFKTTRNADGSIKNSMSLVSIGEQNAQNALFNVALKGTDSIYDTSSFKNFLLSAMKTRLLNFAFDKLNTFLGGHIDVASSWGRLAETAATTAEVAGAALIKNFVSGLYDQVSKEIFSGVALAESSTCREQPQKENFDNQASLSDYSKEAESVINDLPSIIENGTAAGEETPLPPPPPEETPPTVPDFSAVQFDVQPQTVAAGGTVTVTWDATAVAESDPEASVIIFPPLSTDELGLSGSMIYTVNEDTVFTLVVSAGGYSDPKEIPVTVTSGVQGVSTKTFKPRE